MSRFLGVNIDANFFDKIEEANNKNSEEAMTTMVKEFTKGIDKNFAGKTNLANSNDQEKNNTFANLESKGFDGFKKHFNLSGDIEKSANKALESFEKLKKQANEAFDKTNKAKSTEKETKKTFSDNSTVKANNAKNKKDIEIKKLDTSALPYIQPKKSSSNLNNSENYKGHVTSGISTASKVYTKRNNNNDNLQNTGINNFGVKKSGKKFNTSNVKIFDANKTKSSTVVPVKNNSFSTKGKIKSGYSQEKIDRVFKVEKDNKPKRLTHKDTSNDKLDDNNLTENLDDYDIINVESLGSKNRHQTTGGSTN